MKTNCSCAVHTSLKLYAVGGILLVSLGLGGCLARSGPQLPYVKPANSVPAVDPIPVQLAARIEEMEAELQRLREKVERSQVEGSDANTIKVLQDRVAAIEKQLGMLGQRPGVATNTQPEAHPEPPLPKSEEFQNKKPMVAGGMDYPSAPVDIVNAPVPADEKVYREAYSLFNAGQMDQAAGAFEELLQKFPQSKLAAAAIYWIGEARFSQGKYNEAVLQFDRVLKEHPGSPKELNALLKQGQAFEKMGDNRSARLIYGKLASDHPHTSQGRIAGGRLKSLPSES